MHVYTHTRTHTCGHRHKHRHTLGVSVDQMSAAVQQLAERAEVQAKDRPPQGSKAGAGVIARTTEVV